MALLSLLPLLLAVAAAPAASAAAAKLPETYPRCKRTDPDINSCLHGAVPVALKELRGGIPSLGVPSIDPLQISALEIGQGQGPISINMKFTDVTVKGLSDAEVRTVNADLQKFQILFDGKLPTGVLEADYEMSGRILLLPVTGKGRCKLTFTNLEATVGPKGKGTEKKGNLHFDVTDFAVDFSGLDRLQVQFDNLFNGDKTLGESMNRLMNENWEDLWKELQPAFKETFGTVFHQFSKRIFDKVAFNDIFIE